MKRVTLKQVNKILPEMVTLYKGEGYFYFEYDTAMVFKTHSVYVFKLNELTLDQWVNEGMKFYQEVIGES